MTRTQLYPVIAVSAVLVVLVGGYFLLGSRSGSTTAPAAGASSAAATADTIAPDDHTLGSATAPITVIEYAAPSCPVCARFDAEVFPKFKAAYIDTGKVTYVFRVFPLRAADGAAEAIARCLPKDQYLPFIQTLFAKQAEWDPEFGVADAHAALLQIARVAGLTAEKADACIADKAVQARINEISSDGEKRYAIHATPTLIIDGEVQQPGAPPWEALQAAIEAALKKHAK